MAIRKKITTLFTTLLVLVLLISCTTPKGYNQLLIKKGKIALNDIGINKNITYDVTYEDGFYNVNINGNIQKVGMLPPSNNQISFSNVRSANKEIAKIASSAEAKVLDYIANSKIFKEKEQLINYINNIEIKIADFEAPAMYKDNVIYIGSNFLDVDEWTICHEYFHSIVDFTNAGIENQPYAYYMFDEALTDVLTSSVSPEKSNAYESLYSDYHEDILCYIGCFEEDAIIAYFYGYETLWEKVGKDEFDFWVYSLENCFSNEFANICVSCFFNKWSKD